MKQCNAKYVACIASIAQQLLQTPLVVFIDIYFEVMTSAACVQIQLSCPFLIKTLSKKVCLFWYPKNIPGRYCSGKEILHCFTVPFMFPSINCEFIDFELL